MTVTVIALLTIILNGALIFGVISRVPYRDMSGSLGNRTALTLNSVGISAEPERTSIRVMGSVLVPTHYTYWEINRQGNVHTEIYRSISGSITRGLYNRFVRELEDGYSGFMHRNGYDVQLTYFTTEEAALWGADKGVAAFDTIGSTTELLLLNGRTLSRLSVYGEDISKDALAQAVRGLLGERNIE